MWPHISFLSFLTLWTAMSGVAAPVQEEGVPYTPDSLLYNGNERIWLPGEPFRWANPEIWNALDSMDLDNFKYSVESPRKPGRFLTVKYLKSNDGQHAWYVDGDLRYLTYDGQTNASQSNLLGHNYGATPFWFDSTLFWQSGQANWFKHQQRLFHSIETGEIEILPSETPPPDTEDAIVFAMDSASLFINLAANSKEFDLPSPVYVLPHGSGEWRQLGLLNPDVSVLAPNQSAQHLKDYAVCSSAGILFICNTSNLTYVEMPSSWARSRFQNYQRTHSREVDSWVGSKGNTLFLRTSYGLIQEDVADLVTGAEWKPLIVPAPEVAQPGFDLMESENKGWLLAIALGVVSILLGFALLSNGRSRRKPLTPLVLPDAEGQAPLSNMVVQLLSHRGRLLNADQFDTIIGLDQIPSPETRRSRRARIIQVTNAETTARFGHPLVVRTKSESDKRIVLYRIQDFGALD